LRLKIRFESPSRFPAMITATIVLSLITLLVVTDPNPTDGQPAAAEADGIASDA